MKIFGIMAALILAFWLLFAMCPDGRSEPYTLNRWPANTVIVDQAGGEGVRTIAAAIAMAKAGDAVHIYAGQYTDINLNNSSKVLHFIGESLNTTILIGATGEQIFTGVADGTTWRNLAITPRGTRNPILFSGANCEFYNVELASDSFIVADTDTIHFFDSIVRSRDDSTWVVTGNLQLYNTNFGFDWAIGIAWKHSHNVWIKDGGLLFMQGGGFFPFASTQETPGILMTNTTTDANKLSVHGTRMISADSSPLIYASGKGAIMLKLAYAETEDYCTIKDSTAFNSWGTFFENHVVGEGGDSLLYFPDVTVDSEVRMSYFAGNVLLGAAMTGKLYIDAGSSSKTIASTSICDSTVSPPNTGYTTSYAAGDATQLVGMFARYDYHGVNQFTGAVVADTTIVPGMTANNATVTIEFRKDGVVGNAEVVRAIEYKNGYFIVHRNGSGIANQPYAWHATIRD